MEKIVNNDLYGILDVEEQYISPVVLANEPFVGWIKWNNYDADFDKILLRTDANVKLHSFFDVDESEGITRLDDDTWEIPKSALELNGFFGFRANFPDIPDSKKEANFFIDFVSSDKTETIHLVTSVDLPRIQVRSTTCDQIIVSPNSPLPQPISFDVHKLGDAAIADAKMSVDIFGSQIKINIKESKTFPKDHNPLSGDVGPRQNLTVKGKGEGTVTFTLEYTDTINNHYSTVLQEIPIRIEGKQSTTIPLLQRVSDEKQLLLVTN